MTRKVGLSLKLPPEIKFKWVQYCKSNGKTPSEVLRDVVRRLLKHSDGSTDFDVDAHVPDVTRSRIELRLTESERSAVEKIAEQAGYSTNKWIADLVRAYITQEPQFGMNELQVIGESNQQLCAIGRNLNQVARALNRGGQAGDLAFVITRLSTIINEHTRGVNAVMHSNLERWRVTWR